MSKNVGVVIVSFAELAEAFNLRADHKIVAVEPAGISMRVKGQFWVAIEGPTMPASGEHETLPWVDHIP